MTFSQSESAGDRIGLLKEKKLPVNSLMSKLGTFYRSQGIHALDFRCIHEVSCRAGCKKFTAARASFVGDRYGDPIRLVVLSLDPGAGWDSPLDRTLEGVAARLRDDDPEFLPKHRHWYRTFETVAAVLSVVAGRHFATRTEARAQSFVVHLFPEPLEHPPLEIARDRNQVVADGRVRGEVRAQKKVFDVPDGVGGKTWRWTRDPAPVRLTLAEGVPTFDHGECTPARPGRMLRPSAAH